MTRYVWWIGISIWAVIMSLFCRSFLYAQNTSINLSVHYDITGSIVTTWSLLQSGWYSYSSWQMDIYALSSTSGTIYRTVQWSWWIWSGSQSITWYTYIPGIATTATDGIYTVWWYLESHNHGWYLLEDKTIIIDRSGPSWFTMTQQRYTTNVGNTIILSRSTWYDHGISWAIQYRYVISWISPSNTWTSVVIQSSSTQNPLNTTILPIGSYTLSVSAYDRLGNGTTLTGMTITLNPTTTPTTWVLNNNNNPPPSDNTTVLMRDICLCGDYSSSYYDRRCSADNVREQLYMNAYCHNGWTGDATITAWTQWTGQTWNTSIPWVDYIKTVIGTLWSHADHITYTQYNKQEILINQHTTRPATWDKDVLSYSMSRPEEWQLGKVTLLIDSLKSVLPYYGVDQSEEWWYNGTMCYANGRQSWEEATLFEIIRWRILWLQYCTRGGYLLIGILMAILLKHTKIYYYKDHDHMILSLNQQEERVSHIQRKKSQKVWQKK